VEDDKIVRLAGFDIIFSERLQTSSSNTLRNNIAFVKSGLYLGLWKDMTINITNRQDLSSQPWQLYSMVSAGATRTQLGKVIQINSADTTGADPTAP
jgi:Phage capsid protein